MTRTSATERSTAVGVDRHQMQVLRQGCPTEAVVVDLLSARGRVLAEDIQSPGDLPRFDNAAMDGYAVRATDLILGRTTLPVSGDLPAGSAVGHRLEPGTAVRIMTGAPLPWGADTVVQVEWTDAGTTAVDIHRLPELGSNIRRQAQEVQAGAAVLNKGSLLTPARLGLLAALGVKQVRVHRAPRVAVLTAGSELISPGEPSRDGGVYNANASLLAALIDADGADTTVLPCLPDDAERVLNCLLFAAETHDVVVTAGGISAGAYEVVRQALERLGTVSFYRVAMTPGSPQGHGKILATPVLALPGNPTAALVSYLVFGRPLLRLARGLTLPSKTQRVVLAAPLAARRDVTRFVPAALDLHGVVPRAVPLGGSHRLTSFINADALLRIDPDEECMPTGTEVTAVLL